MPRNDGRPRSTAPDKMTTECRRCGKKWDATLAEAMAHDKKCAKEHKS